VRLLAMRAARRAIEIDPDLAEAHAALGFVSLYELDWPQADVSLRRAIELDPSNVAAHLTYANFLVAQGRFAAAIREARVVVGLEPASPEARHHLGWMLYFDRQYAAAVQELRVVVAMDPMYAYGQWRLGQVHLMAGQYDDAVRHLQSAAVNSNRAPAVLGLLAMAYGRLGKQSEAQRLLDEMVGRAAANTVPASALLLGYLGVGDTRRAIDSLEQIDAAHENYAIYINVDPLMDELRGDSRFQALCQRTIVSRIQ